MERRQFFQNGIMGAIALSFVPISSLFSRTARVEIVDIGTAVTHIRHGLLQEIPTNLDTSCRWLLKVNKNVFLNTGVEEEDNSFVHFQLQTTYGYIGIATNNGIVLFTLNGKNFDISQSPVNIGNDLRVELFRSSNFSKLKIPGDSIVVPLSGVISIDGMEIPGENISYIPMQNDHVSLESEKGVEFCLLTKTIS